MDPIEERSLASVNAVAVSPDGAYRVAGGREESWHRGNVILWAPWGSGRNVAMGEIWRRRFLGNSERYIEGEVKSLAFSPDGKHVLIGGTDPGWEPDSEEEAEEEEASGASTVFHEQSGRIQLVSVPEGNIVHNITIEKNSPEGMGIHAVAFSPDGAKFAALDMYQDVHVFDAATGDKLLFVPSPGNMSVFVLAFTLDSKQLVTINVHDAATGDFVAYLKGHEHRVQAIAMHPDGTRVMTGSEDETMREWDLETYTELRQWPCAAYALGYSADGTHIVSGDMGGELALWNVASGECLRRCTAYEDTVVEELAVASDGTVVTGGAGAARVWKAFAP